jgi:hypothetical protein
VEVARAAVDELLDEAGNGRAGSPLGRQVADLLLGRNLTSEEEPEETLRKRLLATRSLGKKLLTFRNGLATEADTLLRVEDGTLPDEGLDATGTTVSLVQSDLTDDGVAVLPRNEMDG